MPETRSQRHDDGLHMWHQHAPVRPGVTGMSRAEKRCMWDLRRGGRAHVLSGTTAAAATETPVPQWRRPELGSL